MNGRRRLSLLGAALVAAVVSGRSLPAAEPANVKEAKRAAAEHFKKAEQFYKVEAAALLNVPVCP